jgi:nucleoside-diphosphate-sugar epimerase
MLFITGATGFLGRYLVRAAVRKGERVRALVRKPGADVGLPEASPGQVQIHIGDLSDPAILEGGLAGVSAVVHAAATTSEAAPDEELSRRTNVDGTWQLLDACRRSGVRRWVQISSLSANAANTSVYGRTKYQADELVRQSGLRWTILQPGTIFGPGGRGLFAKIVRLTRGLPIVPVLGPGTQPMRPIHAADVADAVLACLDRDETVGQSYALGGGDVITFNDFLRGVLREQGLRKPLVHVPFWVCFPAARLLGLVLRNPPVTVDNLVGLKQMTAPDIEPARRDFGFAPPTFAERLHETFAAQAAVSGAGSLVGTATGRSAE